MGRFQEGAEGVGLSPHIQRCRPVHRNMAKAVALGNYRPNDLAAMYGYTQGQVSRIMGSPAFQVEVARLEREAEMISFDMAKDVQLMAQKALEVLDEDLEMEPETEGQRRLRQNAALEVLGITGIKKTGGGGVHIYQQFGDREAKKVRDLDEDQLREEVLQLTRGEDGTFE